MVMQGFLDSLRGGGADALVDRQCLPQVRGGLAGVAVLQMAAAESFQGACFFWGRADVAGNGQVSSLWAARPGPSKDAGERPAGAARRACDAR
jgi:hypothetical protein